MSFRRRLLLSVVLIGGVVVVALVVAVLLVAAAFLLGLTPERFRRVVSLAILALGTLLLVRGL